MPVACVCFVVALMGLAGIGCQRPASPGPGPAANTSTSVSSTGAPPAPGVAGGALSDGAAPYTLDSSGRKYLRLEFDPSLPHLGRPSLEAYKARPGTTVRIRAIETMDDGSTRDATEDPDIYWLSSKRNVATATKGVVTIPATNVAHAETSISVLGKTKVAGFVLVVLQPPVLPEKMQEAIRAEFPGFRVPTDDDVTPKALFGGEAGSYPFVRSADFDGNGLEDTALFLASDAHWVFAILHQTPGGAYETAFTMRGDIPQGKRLESVLETAVMVVRKGETLGETTLAHDSLYFEASFGLAWNGKEYEKIGVPYE